MSITSCIDLERDTEAIVHERGGQYLRAGRMQMHTMTYTHELFDLIHCSRVSFTLSVIYASFREDFSLGCSSSG